ncbi:adenosylhomocysteinase [Thermofilum pendens]|uniref:Adenosylhomocysteinase n=1 Tax=Thermofilum pendens (strain DSM 2475 / Hrk 5) TaxID=368408 RepID=A1RXU1_THEPD|nr:adenosylhomocysteinase [Thermofilum pendens]ABL78021.1 adenosylhomocysteinase [Thermofilum pendens Hrk 5]
MEYRVKDISLAPKGRLMVEWAERHMAVLRSIKESFSERQPLKGVKIAACMHVTKETAVLMLTLKAAGAEIALAASNPLSTQDPVAAYLASEGVSVFAWKGMTEREYFESIARAASIEPDITMDDGGDLTVMLHKLSIGEAKGLDYEVAKEIVPPDAYKRVVGGTEETTTGVIRLRALEREGKLLYPVIAVNDSMTKYMFDNRFGTGQSTLDGILRATNILLAGKNVVVAGYGWVGRGIAWRARGMGARVIVVEADPIKALEAYYEGFYVTDMREASKIGDVFITATGNRDVVREEHFLEMRDGAILANAGHFNVEISVEDLERISTSKRRINENVEEYTLRNGKKLYLLSEGRLVNLAAAEGHPSEVMDLSFGNQALAVHLLWKKKGKLKPKVYRLPAQLDRRIALIKLKSLGVRIERLTPKQVEYLRSWTA